ncbi:hypothetical protein [Alkalihalobacillus pseudalcaliphilus]|uniref:hypothetical protein n=1 Tax=Alkalihalobacillus pseudalcaliphilus TaxID=79884 RepID=UPI00235F0CF1|nr:hypothetical protein [Alkalihalobacillus pseudalcaliphilus]
MFKGGVHSWDIMVVDLTMVVALLLPRLVMVVDMAAATVVVALELLSLSYYSSSSSSSVVGDGEAATVQEALAADINRPCTEENHPYCLIIRMVFHDR